LRPRNMQQIGSRSFGPGCPCIVVAEVAQAHDGSLGMAHAFIDAAAGAGADAVKFQTHIAAAESTASEPWRTKFSFQDGSRYEYWKRMEFTEEQWHGLRRHADDRGLLFLSSPFSVEAVELLSRVVVAAWKVASGEVSNTPMLERIAATRLPVLISTGMSGLQDIDQAVSYVTSKDLPLVVLQCTSMYPTPPDKIGLNMIPLFRERYGCAVGLSDHSGTIYAGLAAAAVGIEMLEVHLTLSRDMFGPDVPVSITPPEFRQLVDGIRFIETARKSPVDKDSIARELIHMRELFGKSVVARVDLPAGTILERSQLTVKKPGIGIPASRLSDVVGKRLIQSVRADEPLKEAFLE